jgi:hypothetical protein
MVSEDDGAMKIKPLQCPNIKEAPCSKSRNTLSQEHTYLAFIDFDCCQLVLTEERILIARRCLLLSDPRKATSWLNMS